MNIREAKVIFNVPTSDEKNYPFQKKKGHFKRIKILDDPQRSSESRRTIYVAQKVPTHNIARNKKEWILIEGNTLKKSTQIDEELLKAEAIKARAFAFTRANSEMFNFSLGAVKYRLEEDCVASERISSFTALYDSLENSDDLPIFEDMGRVILSKWLYEEDDLHFDNVGIDEFERFTTIDHACTLGSLTVPFYNVTKQEIPYPKYLQQSIKNWDHFPEKQLVHQNKFSGLETWILRNRPSEFMGELNAKDFETLPRVKHRVARNWQFNDLKRDKDYAKRAMRNSRFIKEKCLQAFKEWITQDLTQEFYRIHVSHKSDQSKAHALIDKNVNKLLEIVCKSSQFKNYLNENFSHAVKIIFYEIREFIFRNKHYRAMDDEHDKLQWQQICDLVFAKIHELKKALKKEFNPDEEKQLREFTDLLYQNQSFALKTVRHCYQKQDMNLRAGNVHELIFKPNTPKNASPLTEAKQHQSSKLSSADSLQNGSLAHKARGLSLFYHPQPTQNEATGKNTSDDLSLPEEDSIVIIHKQEDSSTGLQQQPPFKAIESSKTNPLEPNQAPLCTIL